MVFVNKKPNVVRIAERRVGFCCYPYMVLCSINISYTIPCPSMASTTFSNPAMLAPAT